MQNVKAARYHSRQQKYQWGPYFRVRSKFEFKLEFRYDGIWLKYELIKCKWINKYIYLCQMYC